MMLLVLPGTPTRRLKTSQLALFWPYIFWVQTGLKEVASSLVGLYCTAAKAAWESRRTTTIPPGNILLRRPVTPSRHSPLLHLLRAGSQKHAKILTLDFDRLRGRVSERTNAAHERGEGCGNRVSAGMPTRAVLRGAVVIRTYDEPRNHRIY